MSRLATMRAPTYSISHLMNAVRNEMTQGSEKGDVSERDLKVSLEESDLWRRFNKLTNEMIVTKTGRRMFPVLSVNISGLNPNSMYSVLLDFAPVDENRWKYVNGEWVPGGKPDSPPPSTAYIHPDSPNFGAHWMKQSVGFSKVKLSNKLNGSGQIMLNSLHKYEPRIHVIRVGGQDKQTLIGSFSFSETQFIAVTAYQNEDITQLKIKYNPFAKAFLDIKENKNDSDIFDDCHDQPKYPQLGGWFLPGGPNAHQFAQSLGLPSASSHGCERYSSLRAHRTSPYPPPPYQKYTSSGSGYSTDSTGGLSLLSPQDTWSSLVAASQSTSMSHQTHHGSIPTHGSIPNQCSQYGSSSWPPAASYSVASTSYSSPHPSFTTSSPVSSSLLHMGAPSAGGTNSPSPSGSPYHQPVASPSSSNGSVVSTHASPSCSVAASYQHDVQTSYQDIHALNHTVVAADSSSAFTNHSAIASSNTNQHHSTSNVKMASSSSSWSPHHQMTSSPTV